MELYQLRSFLEVAANKNLTRAAASLHISQSALSSQIKQLEDELELQLFKRSPKGMLLTDQGRELHSYAGEVINAADKFKGRALQLNGQPCQTVRIGINTDGSFLKVGQLSRLMLSKFSETHCVFVASQTIRTPEMLRQELIDIGFFFGENAEQDIYSEVISYFDIRIVIPDSLLEGAEITWPVLAALPWIWSVCDCPYYQVVQTEMDKLGLEPNRLVDAMDESVVKELVMDGQGLAILREDEALEVAARSRVRIWEEVKFTIPLSLGSLRSNHQNQLNLSVTEVIKQLWGG